MVAQGYLRWEAYFESVLGEFAEHMGWFFPVVLVVALAISVWTIHSSLRPLKALSARALRIGPNTSDMRLPETELPEQIRPLIRSVNSALDRLEYGLQAQSRFTGNAAHELRTPLAVLPRRAMDLATRGAVNRPGEAIAPRNRPV